MTSILVRNGSTVPPELLGSVPRDVRLTGAGIALAAVGIALVVGDRKSTRLNSSH